MNNLTSSLEFIRKPDESKNAFQARIFLEISSAVANYYFSICNFVITQDEIKATCELNLFYKP